MSPTSPSLLHPYRQYLNMSTPLIKKEKSSPTVSSATLLPSCTARFLRRGVYTHCHHALACHTRLNLRISLHQRTPFAKVTNDLRVAESNVCFSVFAFLKPSAVSTILNLGRWVILHTLPYAQLMMNIPHIADCIFAPNFSPFLVFMPFVM